MWLRVVRDPLRERLAALTLVQALSKVPSSDSAEHVETDDASRDDRDHESTFLIHEKRRLACGGIEMSHLQDDADTRRK